MAEKITIEIEADVKKAVKGIEELGDQVKNIDKSVKAGSKATEKLGKGFKGVGLAMKAAGIGLFLKAFQILGEVFMSNQKVMDAFNIGMEVLKNLFAKVIEFVTGPNGLGEKLKGVFSDPKQAVIDLWTTIKENLVNRLQGLVDSFKAVGKIIKSALSLDWDSLKEGSLEFGAAFQQTLTGVTIEQWKEVTNQVKTFVNTTKDAIVSSVDHAKALVNLRNKVILLEASQQGLMLTYQKEAELQRQIRDDVTATFEDRIQANQELGKILEEQLEAEKNIINEKIKLAKLELANDKNNIDFKANLIAMEGELLDLEERITGQRSEQLTNQNSLLLEQRDIQRELSLIGKNARELELAELDIYYQQLIEKANLAGQKTVEIEKQYANMKKQIAIKSVQEGLDIAGGLMGAMNSLFEGNEKAQKAFAIGQIMVDTAKGLAGAVSAGAGVPFPGNLAAILTGVTTVLTNIAAAKKALKGGGGSSPTPGGSASTVPAVTTTAPNIPDLPTPPPVEAYVLSGSVTTAQSADSQIQLQSTL